MKPASQILESYEKQMFSRTVGETWHGTVGGYNNHNCRCMECRKAAYENHKKYINRVGRYGGVCVFGGCKNKAQKFERHLCKSHYKTMIRLVNAGVRTWEEIEMSYKHGN